MLENTDRIYKCGSTCKLTVHEVYDRNINIFSRDLSRLNRLVRDTDQGDTWREFTGRLKRYRFLISASPIPLNSSSLEIQVTHQKLSRFLELVSMGRSVSSEIIETAIVVLTSFSALAEMNTNRLYLKLIELLKVEGIYDNVIIVVLSNELVKVVRTHFDRDKICTNTEVLIPHDLKGTESFKRIIIFGSPEWYSARDSYFLFTAPRAPQIDILSYAWINNRIRIDSVFDCPQPTTPDSRISGEVKISVKTDAVPSEVDIENAEDFIPLLDIARLKRRLDHTGTPTEPDETDDIVEARIVILSQKKAVYIESSDTSSSFVLRLSGSELDEDSELSTTDDGSDDDDDEVETEVESDEDFKLLGRCLNVDLEEGMFLILRTRGGGDLIVPVADMYLDKERDMRRNMQKDWKRLFGQLLKNFGQEKIQRKIIETGGTKVHEATLRNWAKERNIRPGRMANFRAVLNLIGLSTDAEKYIENTKVILHAHQKAGGIIRKLLLEQIRKSDLKKLITDGAMVFDLPGLESSASMTAFRIEQILDSVHQVPYYRIGHPVDILEDLWR